MDEQRGPGLAALAYAITRGVLAVSILGASYWVVYTAVNTISGNGQIVSVDRSVPFDQLASLRPTDACSDPECVMAPDEVPVTVVVLNGDGEQIALQSLMTAASLILGLTLLWLIHSLFGTLRRSEPFKRENVNRLRKIGLLLLLGWPALEILHKVAGQTLAATTSFGELGTDWNIPPAPGAIAGGVIVLIIAQIFSRGLELREDVEGTV